MFYFLDTDPRRAARLLADGDIESSECAEELVGVLRRMRIRVHGTCRDSELQAWVGACYPNWRWALDYAQELCNEHLHRFRRLHGSARTVLALCDLDPIVRSRLCRAGNTVPPLLMPTPLQAFVVSYVAQYRWWYGGLRRDGVWTRRTVPEFILPERRKRVRVNAPTPIITRIRRSR